MLPIGMKHPLAVLAIVAVVSISSASALFGLRDKPVDLTFDLLPDKDGWSPERFMLDLSKGYQPQYADYYQKEYGLRDEISGTVYSWLSRTGDKRKPATIFNKYSVKDLLNLNLVYKKKATIEEYDRRRQMCEELSPGKVDEKVWRGESRLTESAEAKLLNQKYFLSQYCWTTFEVFRSLFMENLERKVEQKLGKKDAENLGKFRGSLIDQFNYESVKRGWSQAFKEHVMGYDEEELAKVKASCQKLERLAATYRLEEFEQTFYGKVFKNCKQIKTI